MLLSYNIISLPTLPQSHLITKYRSHNTDMRLLGSIPPLEVPLGKEEMSIASLVLRTLPVGRKEIRTHGMVNLQMYFSTRETA